MRFLTENKRRNLINAGTIYLLGSGTILKLSETMIDGMGMPSWIMRTLAAVLFAGLPLALVFAWRKGDEIEEDHSEKSAALIAPKGPAPARSIAVLPFVNMSSDEEQGFFSDGLSEELLNLLAKVSELQVASRTSAFAFKGETIDIPTMAKKLNVAYVLEGSVRKSARQVRVTAQLINAADDVHEWSETYDRMLDDIFVIQDEIGAAVVEALKVQLLGAAVPTVVETDAEAYGLFLKARHCYRHFDSEGLAQAEALLMQAIAIDDGYAPAWNTLGMVYSRHADIGDTPWDVGYDNARNAIEKALKLDPGFADAYASLGWIAFVGQHKLQTAARHYSKALELQPGNGEVLSDATLLALALGRVAEAVSLGEQALVRDPINVSAHRYLAAAYIMAGRPDDAEKSYRQALALSPGYIGGYFHLGRVLLAKGDKAAALESMEKETHPGFKLTGLALAHHALGSASQSEAAVAALHRDWSEEAAYQIAEVHAFCGEIDTAFEWLAKAVEQNDPGISTMKVDPLLAALYEDSRWHAMLGTIGMADATLAAVEFDVLGVSPSPGTVAAAG